MISTLIDQHAGRFAALTCNVDDAFEVPWGEDRFYEFYSFVYTPSFMVDGSVDCQSSDYATCVQQRLGQATDVTIELSGSQVSGATWDINADICGELSCVGQTYRFHTAATLSHRPGLPDYSRNVLMQDVITQNVSVTPGECQRVVTRVTFDSESWSNRSDIAIVSWLQESASSGPAAVIQAGVMNWPFPDSSELTTIEINPSSVDLAAFQSIDLTATGKDQNGNDFDLDDPVWYMTGTAGGTFDPERGSAETEFSAERPGTGEIVCTDGDVTARIPVVITGETPALTTITVVPTNPIIDVGQSRTLTALGSDQYGDNIDFTNPMWSITGEADGTFQPAAGSASTSFTATSPGTGVVLCTDGDVTGQTTVTVEGEDPVLASLVIDPSEATIPLGSTQLFTASGTDQYGGQFPVDGPMWSLSGECAGSFDPMSGATTTFTANAIGTCTVTAEEDGVSATAGIEVTDGATTLPKPRRIQGRHQP